jgi:small-conductance mechanosensitive channel
MAVQLTEFLTRLTVALGGAFALATVVHLLVRQMARRWWWADALLQKAAIPSRLFVLAATLNAVVAGVRPDAVAEGWWDAVELVCRLSTIGTGAWLVAAALLFVEDLGLRKYSADVRDDRAAARVRTQGLILRRLTLAAVVVLALGAALYSFPGVRAIGASVLASAGLVGVVAAVAAQSTLANLVAGVQIAFSDAIRLGDVVIVEEEWGRVEEITLSYVVVRLWDDRRLVLPSTYFNETPFQNWTRHSSELLGAVELDVDWRVDVSAMRAELDRILERTELWDGRSKVLQVTDAVGDLVRLRVLVSAADAGTLWDLRCLVREELVTWLQSRDLDGLPRQRVEMVEHEDGRSRRPRETQRTGLFSGDAAGEERAARFRTGEQEHAAADAPSETVEGAREKAREEVRAGRAP